MRALDTFVGRPVTAIDVDANGNWYVALVGDIRVANFDSNNPQPQIPNPQSLTFISVILSDEQTQMVLAQLGPANQILQEYRVPLNATKYGIYDPSHSEEAYNPQMPGTPLKIPPIDEARTVDGPEPQEEEITDDSEEAESE